MLGAAAETRGSIAAVVDAYRAHGLFKHSCRYGNCCESFWADLEKPMPSGIGYLSVYSRTDGIVSWRACLDPCARHVEVDSSHSGMSVNRAVYRVLGEILEEER